MKDADALDKWASTAKVGETDKVMLMRMNDDGKWIWKTISIKTQKPAVRVASSQPAQEDAQKKDSMAVESHPTNMVAIEYDKFKDKTVVRLKDSIDLKIKGGGGGTLMNHLSPYYAIDGDHQKDVAKPENFVLDFYIGSDGWVLLDQSRTIQLIVIVDDIRIKLDKAWYDDKMTDNGATLERVGFVCTPEQYAQISSGKKVECQLGTLEFSMTDDQKAQLQLLSKQAGIK